jgi:hypothetical protein
MSAQEATGMSQPTRKQTMQRWSLGLVMAVVFFIGLSALQFSHEHFKDGFGLVGVGILAVAALISYTIPTKCRIITAKGRLCPNDAYGFLFGCHNARGHRLAKLFARLGWQRENLKDSRQRVDPEGSLTLNVGRPPVSHIGANHAQEGFQAILLTVPNAGMGVCGFWFGLISTLAAVAAVIVGVVGLAK